MTVQRCTDCGYTWEQGTDGRHGCKRRIMEQRNAAEFEVARMRWHPITQPPKVGALVVLACDHGDGTAPSVFLRTWTGDECFTDAKLLWMPLPGLPR